MAESLPVKSQSHPFEVLEHLGEGGYGTVDLVWHEEWGLVAYKQLTTSSMPEKYLSKLKEESRIQQGLHHPNIVTLYDAQFQPPVCGLFLEYVKYGTIEKFLEDFKVSSEWKVQIMYDVALAMAYLHRQKPVVIHGDLKSQNILIGSHYRAKVSDFGLAHAHKTVTTQSLKQEINGTRQFIAPEYFSDPYAKKNEKFDVYAYAISVWEILSEKRAYYDFTDQTFIYIHVQNGIRPKLEDIETDEVLARVTQIIENCWRQSKELRPDFKSITAILQGQIRLIQPELEKSYASLLAQEQQLCLSSGNPNSEERMCTSASILNQDEPSGEVKSTLIPEPEDTKMCGNDQAAEIVESLYGCQDQISTGQNLTQLSREENTMSATIAGVQTISIKQNIRDEENFMNRNISLEIAEEETVDRDPRLTVQLLKSIEMRDDGEIVGVTYLENKIYVIFKDTTRVCMFQGRIPYSRMKDTIEVPYMKTPYDMTSSQVSRSIFISDTDEESRCVWRIQMSNKSANQWRVDGIPKGLFLASPDKLIVLVERKCTLRSFYSIYVYQSCASDAKSFTELPQEICEAWHALTLKNGNFVLSYRNEEFRYLISEISADGKKFIRTFDHRSVDTIVLKKWRPVHLAVNEHDHIIVANFLYPRDGGGVFLLNLCTDEVEILLDRENHHVVLPKRLLYMTEKRQLIVSHWLQSECRALVSVFQSVFVNQRIEEYLYSFYYKII